VQFQGVKGNGVDQFKDPKVEVVLWPPSLKNGNVITPYSEAQK